jgi:hypothetical protein
MKIQLHSGTCEVDIPDELLARWRAVQEEYWALQAQIAELWRSQTKS